MRFFRSLIEPGGRMLARHVRRLCQHLQDLTARLREGVATAAGQTASGVVREAVESLLNEHGESRERPRSFPRQPEQPDYLWDREDSFGRMHDPWNNELDDLPPSDEQLDYESEDCDDSISSQRNSWLAPLAIGLQAAGCWLRRRVGRRPLLTALACGLVAALIASRCGPFALAGASLLSLAGIMQTVFDALGV